MSNFIQGKEITYVMVDYENVQPSISHFITHPQTHFIIFVGHQQDNVHIAPFITFTNKTHN